MTKLDGSEVIKRGSGNVGLISQIRDQFVNLQKHLYAEILPEVEHFMNNMTKIDFQVLWIGIYQLQCAFVMVIYTECYCM